MGTSICCHFTEGDTVGQRGVAVFDKVHVTLQSESRARTQWRSGRSGALSTDLLGLGLGWGCSRLPGNCEENGNLMPRWGSGRGLGR